MARRLFIVNPITYYSQNTSPFTNVAGLLPRNSFSEVEPSNSVRSNTPTNVYTGTLRFGPTDGSSVNLTTIGITTRFRVRNTPTGATQLFNITNSGGTVVFSFYLNADHTISFYNGTSTTNLVATSPAISFGQGRTDWTTVQILLRTASDPGGVNAIIFVNGNNLFSSSSIPGVGTGINAATNFNNLGPLFGNNPNVGLDVDIDQVIVDDSALSPPSNYTFVPVISAGFYQDFVGGSPNWEYRNFHRRLPTTVTTTVAGARQSYVLANLRDYGITGNIISATLFNQSQYGGATQFGTHFFRKGGVNTDAGSTFGDSFTAANHKTIFPSPSWTPDDTIEIGILNGAGTGTFTLYNFGCLVEHDTPVVYPDLQTVRAQIINYTGNGTVQSITLPFRPTWVHILPRSGANFGAWWSNGLLGLQTLVNSESIGSNMALNGDQLTLGSNNANVNSNGVIYDVLCIEDRQGRIIDVGSFFQISATSPIDTENYQVNTRMQSPEAVIIPYIAGAGGGFATWYHDSLLGPNNALSFASATPIADKIQEVNTNGFVARKGLYVINTVNYPYFALKGGAFLQTQLVAIAKYTGNGAANQVVPINMNGNEVKWVIILPHNASTRITRNSLMASGATTVVSFGVDTITVGSGPNSNGVTYTVIAFAEGEDVPLFGNNFSGIYALDFNSLHDTLWERADGVVDLVNVKISPLGRTGLIGDK